MSTVNDGAAMKKRAVFLDRDGTLIKDCGYITAPAQVELLPGVPEALALLQERGFKLLVISNQSGIGRGFFSAADVEAVNQHLSALLSGCGVALADFYYCPHKPEDGCACRKPQPGLILQAVREHGIDKSKSYFAGDKWTDVQAALAAGVQPVLLAGKDLIAAGPVSLITAYSLLTWAERLPLD